MSNLHYTHYYMLDKYKKTLKKYDLSTPQLNVLAIIGVFFPDSGSLEQVKAMVLEPNSDVSRTVSRLVEKGFVKKVVNPDNKRKVSIMITEKGSRTLQKTQMDKGFDYTSDISIDEAKVFVQVLAKLREA